MIDRTYAAVLTCSLGLLACVEDERAGPIGRVPDAVLDADVTANVDAGGHPTDAHQRGTSDPVGDELAAALDASGFRNDTRRQELVVGALCERRAVCGVEDAEHCRASYRVDWNDRIAQGRGIHVPCHDALLDTISCLALAPCDGASACDPVVQTQESVCSAGLCASRCGEWRPGDMGGGAASDDGAAPTKGPIPPEAHNPDGRGLNWELVPDFIPAWGPDGSMAGYVRKVDLMDPCCETKTVVDETLQRIVGHMVPDVGFVPLEARQRDAG